MRTKGVGPRGLGVSPLKQTKKQSIMQNEDGSAYTKEQQKADYIKKITANIQDVPYEGPSQGSGALGLIAGIGGAAARGLATIGREILKRGAGPSKTGNFVIKTAQKILKKTNPKPNPNVRADSFGRTTSVGSRRNYNNTGSN